MLRLGVVLVASSLLTSCAPSLSTTTRPHTVAESQSTRPTPTASATAELTCGTPDASLLERAKEALATHPGPVGAVTLVPAVTTATGSWSVIGIERRYVHDDGTDGGSSSVDFGLVNEAQDAEQKLIPIATGSTEFGDEGFTEDWRSVSWRGPTLVAGKRALAFARTCLEAARAGEVIEP